jgi:isocitrate lyase
MDVPTILVARTDADSAKLLLSDADPRDHAFIEKGERTPEGFFRLRGGLDCAIARGLAYAPYADLLWCETSTPDLGEAKRFAEGIHRQFPGKMLAYNCSPSFNWRKHLDEVTIARFQKELAAMGYCFQFVTLAGFHALNHGMFELARGYREAACRLPRAANGRVRGRSTGLHRHEAPARGGDGLLRPGDAGAVRRAGFHAGSP